MKKQQGFSLMEVMLVMMIIVVLSAGGFYGWQRWQQQQQLWITLQQVRHLLEQLRSDANWHNRDHLLSLSKTASRWCLASQRSPDMRCESRAGGQLAQPFPDIDIVEVTPGLGFYGRRNTAWPGHIAVRSPAGEWLVILSAWGRIRTCQTSGARKCS